jgi:hypothetical protein
LAIPLLDGIDIKGMVIKAEALLTQHEIADYLVLMVMTRRIKTKHEIPRCPPFCKKEVEMKTVAGYAPATVPGT